jgi:chromate transport protein ChrA
MLGIALGIRNIQSQLPDLVYALLSGLNAATVGLIALAAVQLSERAITNQMTRFIICATGCVGLLYAGFPFLSSVNYQLCGTILY